MTGPGWTIRVFLGSIAGASSPVTTHTPLLGAEIRLEPGARLTLDTDPSFEHGLLVDAGAPTVDGRPVADGAPGPVTRRLQAAYRAAVG